MVLNTKLQLRQAQSLALTPQLLQSIRLLHMTRTELEQFVLREAEKNPLVELAPANPKTETATASSDRHRSSTIGRLRGDEGFDFTQVPESRSLRQHVREQIALGIADSAIAEIATHLADNLDDDGYLRIDLDAFAHENGIERAHVDIALAACKRFDPSGIFAADLKECLSLQLLAARRLTPALQVLLTRLDLLARRDFGKLAKLCGVNDGQLAAMVRDIRALDPRPGHAFYQEQTIAVVPEVQVRRGADGSWSVEIDDASLPKVLVNNSYARKIMPGLKEDDRRFVTECLQSGSWLARSLDQRMRTILAVASEIVRHQQRFFEDGVSGLRPLSLKMVAEAVGMHESTVSRVTANKHMMTPRGLFELRYFFTGSVNAADGGEAHAAQAVREQIRHLIEQEHIDDVLSDDTLVDVLKKQGIDIARRTVAKYREALGIPSSVQRRREKRIRKVHG